MLLELTIENFRSVHEPQTLSFEAVKDKRLRSDHLISVDERVDLLKSAFITGANGSGKSTFVRALEMLQGLVLAPEDDTHPLVRMAGSSFALDRLSRGKPSALTVSLMLDGRIYTYHVSADSRRVHRETLHVQVGRATRRLFERELTDPEGTGSTEYTYSWGKKYEGPKTRLGNKIGCEHLFLGAGGRAGSPSLQPVISWFERGLRIVPAGLSYASEELIIRQAAENPEVLQAVEMVLSAMDQQDVREVRTIEKDGKSRLVFVHGRQGTGYASHFTNESVSVRRLTMLAVLFWKASRESTLLASDDFGLLLHEQVVRKLYETFFTETAGNGSQLMTTGCDTVGLSSDLLRYDEMWLTSRLLDGSTKCYSIADYNIKKDDDVRMMYLQGAFGAFPITIECPLTQAGEKSNAEKA